MELTTAVANVAFFRAGQDEPFKTVPIGFGQSVPIPEKAHRVQLFLTPDPVPWDSSSGMARTAATVRYPAEIPVGAVPPWRSADRGPRWLRWIVGRGTHR